MHAFIKMAGLKNEKEFYKKYKSPDDFFKEFPEARNGYTLNDNVEELERIEQMSPQRMDTNFNVNSVVSNAPVDVTTQSSAPQTSSTSTTGLISSAANAATDVIGGIGSFWRNVQVAAPQLLNALIPDQHNERTVKPKVATNQYAYGTGSQMMYQNGGSLPILTFEQASQRQAQNKPYQVSQYIQDMAHNSEYPIDVLRPLPSVENFNNPSYRNWESLPEVEQPKGNIPLTIQEYVYDEKGRKTNQTRDVETMYFTSEAEKDAFLKRRQKEKGYGLWFKGDTTKTVAIDTRSRNTSPVGPIGMLSNGGTLYDEGGEYELDPSEIKRLKQLGYEIEML